MVLHLNMTILISVKTRSFRPLTGIMVLHNKDKSIGYLYAMYRFRPPFDKLLFHKKGVQVNPEI